MNRDGYDFEPELDLHGLYVDEALEAIERFLDHAMLYRRREVSIIHGHGSGKLKNAVRTYLATSPYVDTFDPGEPWEGGDGVTIVIIKNE